MISEISISRTIWWLLLLSLTAHQMIAATANQNTMAVKPYLTAATMSHQQQQQEEEETKRNFTATKLSEQSINNVVEHGNSVTDAIPKPIPLALPMTNAIQQAANSKDGKPHRPTTAIKVNRMMRRVRKSLLPTTSNKSVAVNRTTALRSFNTKYRQQHQQEHKQQEQEQQKHKSDKQQLQQKPKVKERIVGVEVTEQYQTNTQQSINDNVTAPNAITSKEAVHHQDTQRNTSWAPMIVYPVNSNAGSGYIEFDMNREEQEDYRNYGGQYHNETRQATIQEMLSNLFPKGFSDILRFSNIQENEPTTTESPPAPVWIPPKIQTDTNSHNSRRFHQKYRRDLSNLELNKLSRSIRSANEDPVLDVMPINDRGPIEDTSEADSTEAQKQDNELAESEINEIEYKPSESLHYQTFPNHNITIHIIHDNPNDEDDDNDEIDDDKSYFKAHFKSELDSNDSDIDDENINSAPSTKLITHQAFRENTSSSGRKSQKFNVVNTKSNAWRNRETFLKPPPPVATIDAKRKYRNFQRNQNPRTSTTVANENFDYKTRYRTLNRNTEMTNVNGRNSTPVNVMFVTFNSAGKANNLSPTQIPTMTPMYPNLTPEEYVKEKKFGSKYNRNINKTKATNNNTNNKTNTENIPNTYTSVEIQKSINIHNKLIREQDGKLLEEREEFPNGTVIINPLKEVANMSYNSTQKRATQMSYGLLSQYPILVEGDDADDEADSKSIEDEGDVETSASSNNEEHVPAPSVDVEQTEVEAIQQTQPIQEFHIIEYVANNVQTIQNTPNTPNNHQGPPSLSANYPVNVHLVEDIGQQQTHGPTNSPQYSDVNIIPPPLSPNFVQNSYTMPVLSAVQSQQPSQTPQQMEQMVGHPPVLPMLLALPYPVKNPNNPKHPNVPSSADNIINKSLPLDRPPPLFSPPSKKYKVIPHYPIVNANPPPPWPANFYPPNYLPANGHLNPFNSLHKYFNKLFHKAPHVPPSNHGLQVFPIYPKSKQIPVNFIKSGNTLKYEFLRSSLPASANVNPSPAFYDANRDKVNRYINDYNSLPRDLTAIHTVIQNPKANKRLLPAHKENGTVEGRNGQQLKRSPTFGRNLHVEYGFKPPLIPSVEINEEGIPLKSVGASLGNDLM